MGCPNDSGMTKPYKRRWMFLSGILLAAILLPFFLLAQPIEGWMQRWLQSAAERGPLTALILGTLLAADVVLPIPSSLVSTTAGALHGLWPGALISTAGMTLSCVIGYGLGASAGRRLASRLISPADLSRCEALHQRSGAWMIVVARSIPVLAEASTFYAGMGRMQTRRFIGLSALSNLGISLVYAALGASMVQFNSFLLAFGAAVLCPAIAMFLVTKRYPSATTGAQRTTKTRRGSL